MKGSLNVFGSISQSKPYQNSWDGSIPRNYGNGGLRGALPDNIRNCFKQFKTVTATNYYSSTNTTSNDYFAFAAEKEVFGSRSNSNPVEANVLTQFEWYQTAANRQKKAGTRTYTSAWWLRSPYYNNSSMYYFCEVSSQGTASDDDIFTGMGYSYFGCM